MSDYDDDFVSDVNPTCGHHIRKRCNSCMVCTTCDGCYCGED